MIKKIDKHKIKFTWEKKKYHVKPMSQGNLGYPVKLVNQVIDSIKFNNLI